MTGACQGVRIAAWLAATIALLCCLGNYTMNTIFANVLLVGFGGVLSCIGLLVAIIGLLIWRGSIWAWPIVGNLATLSLVIWMFAANQVPAGYGP